MSDQASKDTYLTQQDTDFRSGIATNFWQISGGTMNYLLDRVTPSTTTLLCGSSGTFTAIFTSLTNVPQQSGSLTVVANRPIIAGIISDGSGNPMQANVALTVLVDNTTNYWISGTTSLTNYPMLWFTLAAGSHTFQLQASNGGVVASPVASHLRMFVRQL